MNKMDKKDIIDKVKNKFLKDKEERYKGILDYWKNRKPFKDENDIHGVPIVLPEDYKNVIIPNLIRCGAIPKKNLKVGKTYIGDCRNATEAVWNGKVFTYIRNKFGHKYEEDINHFEDDDGSDLFVPIKEKE